MTNYCKACGRLRQIARDGFCGGCADADTIAALQRENAALREALVKVRAFKRADGSELLPDWMRRDIDAALTPSAAPGEDSGEDARG